jgi:uncharacterized protein
MRFFVKAKTHAQEERIEEEDATHFTISVKVAPIDGKANEAIKKILAKHLLIAPSLLILRSGITGKNKVFEMLDILK